MFRTIISNRDPRTGRLIPRHTEPLTATGPVTPPEAQDGPQTFIALVQAERLTDIEIRGGRLLALPFVASRTDLVVVRELERLHREEPR